MLPLTPYYISETEFLIKTSSYASIVAVKINFTQHYYLLATKTYMPTGINNRLNGVEWVQEDLMLNEVKK